MPEGIESSGKKVLLYTILSSALLFPASNLAYGAEIIDNEATALEDQQTEKKVEFSLEPVEVTATYMNDDLATHVMNGALGSRSELDTPFSTTVVSSKELAERQISKLGDVFATDASVSNNSDAYSSWNTNLMTVRGLQLDWHNSSRINGMHYGGYGMTLPYEHFEQIELLKGLSGFMYGFGSPGGIINYITKKPTDTPVGSVEVGYKSDSIGSIHLDVGERFGEDNKFGYRLNMVHEEGSTYNGGSIDRDSVSLALDARLTDKLTWNLDVIDQDRKSTDQTASLYTYNYSGSRLPRVISNSNSNLTGNGQYFYSNFRMYTTNLQYQMNPGWKLSSSYSYNKSTRSRNENMFYLLNSAGDYDDYKYARREAYRFSQWQMMLEGEAQTGQVAHQLVIGAANQRQASYYSSNSVWDLIGGGNLYSSNDNIYYNSVDLDLYKNNRIMQKSIFASDTMQLSERWSLLTGLRYTDYEQRNYNTSGNNTSSYVKSGATTPTVAFMYKLRPNTMLYTSYAESLEQGATVSGKQYANYGAMLDPLKSKQYELGIKSDHKSWSMTAALFRIERGAEYVNSTNYYVQDGEAIYQGLEVGASTKLGSQWELGSNLMWLDTSYEKGYSYNGNRVAGAPKFIATAQVAYHVPKIPGLKLTADAKYTGNTMVRASNDLKVPGYPVINVGASYATRINDNDVTFRVVVNNVTNKRNWEYQQGNFIRPGDPRTISISAKFDF